MGMRLLIPVFAAEGNRRGGTIQGTEQPKNQAVKKAGSELQGAEPFHPWPRARARL